MRASAARWLPADIDLLRRLVGEGKTDREIAHAMGRTEQSVICARNRNDMFRATRVWDAASIRELAELRAQGLTVNEISEAMGRSPRAVKPALSRYGIQSTAPTRAGKLAGPVSLARPYTRAELAWARANYDTDRQAKLVCAIHHGAKLRTVFEDAPVRPGRIDVRAA